MTRILITGASGQVGHALLEELKGLGTLLPTDLTSATLEQDFTPMDLNDPTQIRATLHQLKPDLIIHPAAYTAVDKAEDESELANNVNGLAPGALADYGAPLIHFSTDYVFDGSGSDARNETASTKPLGVYGETKRTGEIKVQQADVPSIILRTAWVFSSHGHNFVKTMLRLAKERESLSIVSDQIGAPTSALFLARAVRKILTSESQPIDAVSKHSGLYHLTCSGETSWHGFAVEIFAQARHRGMTLAIKNVSAISTSEYPTPAQRPLNSRLDCSLFEKTFGMERDSWQEALSEVMDRLLA